MRLGRVDVVDAVEVMMPGCSSSFAGGSFVVSGLMGTGACTG